jgi:anti-sigma regulatory factor (Ser/Thr protein kinase)
MPISPVERTFSSTVRTPLEARNFVKEALRRWGQADLEETACLLTTELVTNAVIHATTDITVRASSDGELLHIEVEDASRDPLQERSPLPYAESGRGLLLVDALSDKWGARQLEGGKIVWFDVSWHEEAEETDQPN